MTRKPHCIIIIIIIQNQYSRANWDLRHLDCNFLCEKHSSVRTLRDSLPGVRPRVCHWHSTLSLQASFYSLFSFFFLPVSRLTLFPRCLKFTLLFSLSLSYKPVSAHYVDAKAVWQRSELTHQRHSFSFSSSANLTRIHHEINTSHWTCPLRVAFTYDNKIHTLHYNMQNN